MIRAFLHVVTYYNGDVDVVTDFLSDFRQRQFAETVTAPRLELIEADINSDRYEVAFAAEQERLQIHVEMSKKTFSKATQNSRRGKARKK
jgi:hypothetical protein